MPKKWVAIIVILIGLLFLFNLTKQISESLKVSNRLDQAADEVSKLQERNRILQKKLSQTQQYEFLEENVRNKLNLAQPNETVVIIPPDQLAKALQPSPTPYIPPPPPNWQGWLRLFFH
jgi:cell division protein FtsB